MKPLPRLLALVQARQDLAFVAVLMTTVAVMLIPLPVGLLDVLIALNLTLTVTVLLVAVYLDRSTSFSTFPAVILIATTFRLAISISTTRSVLTQGEAGEIVGAFGHFVTGGNVAVGLVVFLIIAIVQFVVVTKGAERVAEVAARFVLDALPGRQMSIDADLRAGDIDAEEARRRRRQVDKENQFFGAMDGAMKFVKGDAIAGLLIVAVNLIGGLVIGVVQMKMPLAQAGRTYSLLTIGDGLVAQIPALLIAMCAGIVITRVTSDETSDLGSEILGELTGSGRSLGVAGVVVMGLGLVPGFPALIFLTLGGALTGFAVLTTRRAARTAMPQATDAAAADRTGAAPGDRVVLRLGQALADALDRPAFAAARGRALTGVEQRLGLSLPLFGILADAALADHEAVVEIDGVPLADAAMPAGAVLVLADAAVLDLAGVAGRSAGRLSPRPDAVLVEASSAEVLRKAGAVVLSAAEVLAGYAVDVMVERGPAFVGFDVVQAMLRTLRSTQPDLADQVNASVAPARVLDILRRLAAERVPLAPLRSLFETVVEWAPRETDPAIVAEHVRVALSLQICHALADGQRIIPAYVVEPDLEQALRGALRQGDAGTVFAPPPALAERLLARVGEMRQPLDPAAPRPVIATGADLRRHLRAYLAGQGVDHPVLSFGEVGREFSVHPVGTLALGRDRPLTLAA